MSRCMKLQMNTKVSAPVFSGPSDLTPLIAEESIFRSEYYEKYICW